MAYVRKATTYRLVWQSGPWEGLEVRVRALPFGAILDLAPLTAGLLSLDTSTLDADAVSQVLDPFRTVVEHIRSWEIEDEDEETGQRTPVPVDLDGLLSLEPAMLQEIIQRWIAAQTEVPAPLEQPSNGGGTVPPPDPGLEAGMPMETLPDPGSSSAQT